MLSCGVAGLPQIIIDTLIQRLGDAGAAGLFKVLSLYNPAGFGPTRVAVATLPLCAVWVAVAFNLGAVHRRMRTDVP
jgi:hypothetical protein